MHEMNKFTYVKGENRMRKTVLVIALVCAILAPVFAQGGAESGAKAEKNVKLKLGFQANASSNEYLAAEVFAEEVNKLSAGTVTCEIFAGGQLGDDRSMLEQVAAGAMDMVYAETGRFGLWIPEAEIFGYPFVFDNFDHLKRTMETPYGKGLQQKLIDKGWRILADGYNGTRQTTSNRKIESMADMKGMKLRVPNAEANLNFAKYSGASPTPMPFAEVYLALKTNAVDGQENPLSTINAQKFYEVQKYCALTGHIINDNNYVISEIVYKRLSPAQQDAVTKAAQKAADFQSAKFTKDETDLLKLFTEQGMTITTPDKAPFRTASKPMLDAYIAKYGDAAIKAIDSAR